MLNLHYCGGELFEFSLFSLLEKCDKDKEAAPLHFAVDCCHLYDLLLDGTEDQKKAESLILISPPDLATISQIFRAAFVAVPQSIDLPRSGLDPPPLEPAYVRFSSRLFYG